MSGRALGLALVLVLVAALGGCGKRGSPQPPGPRGALSYPRSYPTY